MNLMDDKKTKSFILNTLSGINLILQAQLTQLKAITELLKRIEVKL